MPTGYRVEAAYAVGRLGDKSKLPEKLQAREAPSTRIPLNKLAFEGGFPVPENDVALHVRPDKVPELKGETFTA